MKRVAYVFCRVFETERTQPTWLQRVLWGLCGGCREDLMMLLLNRTRAKIVGDDSFADEEQHLMLADGVCIPYRALAATNARDSGLPLLIVLPIDVASDTSRCYAALQMTPLRSPQRSCLHHCLIKEAG
jgi:hypothetical protein